MDQGMGHLFNDFLGILVYIFCEIRKSADAAHILMPLNGYKVSNKHHNFLAFINRNWA